ncbi:MAG TPA: DNA-binding domain-containing protein [Caldimonas sp.]
MTAGRAGAEPPDAVATASREALRQRALLAAVAGEAVDPGLTGFAQTGARVAQGLAAYAVNAALVCERALAVAFPTVRTLVGAGDFAQLARGFWGAHPPERGDLGEWGEDFADWLDRRDALAEWPYLGDCARLDFALHRCERAADAAFDGASLTLLQSEMPSRLYLRLMPGTTLLRSAWPIATIHAAHREAEPDFAPVRAALAARRGEHVLVVRAGWRGAVHSIDAPTFEWTQSLLAGADLAGALDRAPAGFDFAGWLATALRASWLQGVACAAD